MSNFSDVLNSLKDKRSVRRSYWPDNSFVYLVPAAAYPAQTGIAKAYFGQFKLIPYSAYFAFKDESDTVTVWTPTTSDLLAEDWLVVPRVGLTREEFESSNPA